MGVPDVLNTILLVVIALLVFPGIPILIYLTTLKQSNDSLMNA